MTQSSSSERDGPVFQISFNFYKNQTLSTLLSWSLSPISFFSALSLSSFFPAFVPIMTFYPKSKIKLTLSHNLLWRLWIRLLFSDFSIFDGCYCHSLAIFFSKPISFLMVLRVHSPTGEHAICTRDLSITATYNFAWMTSFSLRLLQYKSLRLFKCILPRN